MVNDMRYYDEDSDSMHGRHGFMPHDMGRFRGFGLKYWILSIVSTEPSTGAMIMDKVERMSMGHWRPSPGHIYPVLERFATEGYLNVEGKGGKKYYSVTEKGKEVLEGSWFPWRSMSGLSGYGGLEDAVKNVEVLADYIMDNKENIAGNTDLRNKIKNVAERFGTI